MGRLITPQKPWILTYVGSGKNIIDICREKNTDINTVLNECKVHSIDPVEVFRFDPSKHKDASTHWILRYIHSGKTIKDIAEEKKLEESEVLVALTSAGKQQADLDFRKRKFLGLDVGTSKLLRANRVDGKLNIISQRNAFIELPSDTSTLRSLTRQKVNYVKVDDKLYLVGDNAYDYGNVFPYLELKRPMANGMLSIEPGALPVIGEIIKALLGTTEELDSVCAYSVPAVPVDMHKLVQFHTDVIEGIVKQCGYTPIVVNEGVAVANVGLEPYDLTGLALSFGGGLINACLMFKGLSALQISVSHAGDFIDEMSAKDIGVSTIQMTALKESDVIDISQTQTTREGQAIKSYYILCIKHALFEIAKYFNASTEKPHFQEPIHIACAGGGVLIPGFSEVFEKEFNAMDMPFDIAKDGVNILDDPLSATSLGCLIEAELSGE